MARHYEIDKVKKIIFADILALTEKEEAEIAKYAKYGFAVEPRTKKAEKVARLDEEYILNYLKDNQEALDTFTAKKNETAVDEDGNKKHTETGKERKKGYNNALHWFARTFPAEVADITKEIKLAGKATELEKAFKKYRKDNADSTGIMKETEYTRFFYWTRVFVKPAKKTEE